VVVDGCRAAAMPTAFGDEPLPDAQVRPQLWRWTIDPATGAVTDEQLDDRAGDFPRIDDRRAGSANRFGWVAGASHWDVGAGFSFDRVVRHDLVAGTSTEHVYGPHHASGEPVFTPDPSRDGEDDGWVLNLVTDLAEGTTDLVVLDAHDVAAGAVARVRLPRRVPFGFHGGWFPDPT
jgi:carotenoid cleavage dioxygenase